MALMNNSDDSATRHLSRIAHAGDVMANCRDRIMWGACRMATAAACKSGLTP
jgi:hypothetical protein